MPLDVKSLWVAGEVPSSSFDADESAECQSTARDAQTEAVARIVLAASLVEGDPERIELEDLCETLHALPGLDGFDLCAAAACIESLHATGALEAVQVEHWIDEAALAIDDSSLRRTAYQLAVYACAWDGVVTEREEAVLDAIAGAFAFTTEEARVLRESVFVAMDANTWPSRASRDRLSIT